MRRLYRNKGRTYSVCIVLMMALTWIVSLVSAAADPIVVENKTKDSETVNSEEQFVDDVDDASHKSFNEQVEEIKKKAMYRKRIKKFSSTINEIKSAMTTTTTTTTITTTTETTTTTTSSTTSSTTTSTTSETESSVSEETETESAYIVESFEEIDDNYDEAEYVESDYVETEYEEYATAETYSYGVSESDYILLCNVVANEAGSNWISLTEKAKVADVVMNRVNSSLYPNTIYEVLTQEGQFSDCWNYVGLGTYSGYVTEDVKTAVSNYLSGAYGCYGYYSFYGDGVQNYFY